MENNARSLKRYYERAEKEKPAKKPKKDPLRCDVKICRTCRCRGKDASLGNEGGIFCNYIGVTEKSRRSICPAGACTVYEKGSPRKATQDITLIEK